MPGAPADASEVRGVEIGAWILGAEEIGTCKIGGADVGATPPAARTTVCCAEAGIVETQTRSVQETTIRDFFKIKRETKGDIFSPS